MTSSALADLYFPLTANQGSGYQEFEACPALKPWIRCFWVYTDQRDQIVIPDTCMDIILRTDQSGKTDVFFCGINDFTFTSKNDEAHPGERLIGIRFHFWAVASFCRGSLKAVRNTQDQLEFYFPGWAEALIESFNEAANLEELWPKWETFLLDQQHENPIPPVIDRAAEIIIRRKGVLSIKELAAELGIDQRWMERRFLDSYGVSCKRLSLLIRYQLIWQACLRDHDFNIQDTVADYGFYDQAHLLNFFKKYHSTQGLSFFSKTKQR
ncbi:helix-turn-helix domain-containing protein [Holdemania massiliensis]|uniref:helix-turn-helix domain-containing protein n=1 Tax=Holdemania massiliensis TaxID=1468449 RepID=UPI001F0584CF|nr:AraC family transcriptional regulator [Holdemania massiliensis]MCH1941405.1 AraC family transcriptional regulator [Holdemania massiliensis]